MKEGYYVFVFLVTGAKNQHEKKKPGKSRI